MLHDASFEVLLVQFSKFKVLQKAGIEIYTYLLKYKSFEHPEFRKSLMPGMYMYGYIFHLLRSKE